MAERTVLRKDQLEISLHNEKKLIKEGTIKDDNPLDLSEPFRDLCNACRKGDLKVCQEKITEGVNVNARDSYDYTPLILVSTSCEFGVSHARAANNRDIFLYRPVSAGTTKLRNCCSSLALFVNEIHSREKGTSGRLGSGEQELTTVTLI